MKYLLIISLCALIACSTEQLESNTKPDVLSAKEYVEFVRSTESGLVVHQDIEDIRFSTIYKPYEYIMLTERTSDGMSQEDIDKGISGLEGMQYFNFRIKSLKPGVDLLKLNWDGSQEQYFQKGDYLTFAIQQDFKLIDGNDTLACQMCHFARNYNVAPTLDFVLGFSSKEDISDKELIYSDQLFGLGKIRFKIEKKDIHELPRLEI